METLSRTWELMKESFAVISEDKTLVLFPILSSLVLIVMDVYFLREFVRIRRWTSSADAYAFMFLFYCANCFVVIFFNSALMACASLRLSGGEASLADGFRAACSRMGRIFLWSVIAGTVGFTLSMFRRSGLLQRVVAWILGVTWAMATYFIIPVIILEDLDIVSSFKRSSALFRQQWGEEVVSNFSFGVLSFALIVPALVLCFGAFVLLGASRASLGLGLLSVAYVLTTYHVVAAAQGVFTVALYYYAGGGQMPAGFAPELLQSAFSGTTVSPRGYPATVPGPPGPALSRTSGPAPDLVIPGQSLGTVRLGMRVEEAISFLDVPKSTTVEPDGVSYSWIESPGGRGLRVRATKEGLVYEIFAANDPRYATREGLHAGSTFGDVVAALGEPSLMEPHPQENVQSLRYDRLGVAFDLNLRPTGQFANAVSGITVFTPR
jgi:hypothetical protein